MRWGVDGRRKTWGGGGGADGNGDGEGGERTTFFYRASRTEILDIAQRGILKGLTIFIYASIQLLEGKGRKIG